MLRSDIINALIRQHGYSRYLEIGVSHGENFATIECEHKIGVDLNYPADYQMSSDDFFEINEDLFDVVFVDGNHSTAQTYVDIFNALGVLTPEGVVVVHDTCPSAEWMTTEEDNGGCWMGGAWIAITMFRTEPDLYIETIYTDCGVSIIRFGTQHRLRTPAVLTFDFLDENRVRILNLIQPEEFDPTR